MDNMRNSEFFELTDSEKRIIQSVLDRYNFQILNIFRIRSAYKIETTSCSLCLKKMKHGRIKVRNGLTLVDGLAKNGFTSIANYYKTKDDKLYVKRKKYIFYVTEWINGMECSMSNIDETCECVKLLAEFHSASRKIDTKNLKLKSNFKNWIQVFNSNLNDLERFKKIIESKKIKNQFDTDYINLIDNFYSRGIMSIQLLNKSQYYNLSKQAEKNKTICHNSYYYQNIIKSNGKYYIIDLDSIMFDLQINDLGKLIRRLMFKKEYTWDFSKAKHLIEAYNSVMRLSKNELEVMLALIIFPHKFWKLGKKRYTKHKAWNEDKYMHRLDRLVRYDKLEEDFLKEYLKFLDSYEE